MKIRVKFRYIMLLFLVFPPFTLQALTPRETIVQLLKEYSPTGYYIVDGYEKTPDEEISRYMKWKKRRMISWSLEEGIPGTAFLDP